jgi:hypothetical protein
LELAGFRESENHGNDFPGGSWERCEFHRNAFALLPEEGDTTPGMAYVCLEDKGDVFQMPGG